MYGVLTRTWWLLLLRGACGTGFAALVLTRPHDSLGTLALAFGGFAVVDGTLALLTALNADRRHVWTLGADGAGGIAGGLVALAWPSVHAATLLALVTAWAVVRGAAELRAAWELRRQCPREVTLLLAALAALAAAGVLASHASEAAVSIGRETAALAAGSGVLLAVLAVRLSTLVRASRRIQESVTGGGLVDRTRAA